MPTKTLITNEQFERMASSLGPCELIDGEIVKMSPASPDHANIENNIAFLLTQHVKKLKIGRILVGEAGMHVKPGRSRGADVAYISYQRLPAGKRQIEFLRVPPELVAEVKSDDTPWEGVQEKVKDYHEFGVDMVWVADPLTHTVREYPRTGVSCIRGPSGRIDGGSVLPGFSATISEFFDD